MKKYSINLKHVTNILNEKFVGYLFIFFKLIRLSNYERNIYNVRISLEAIRHNKLKSGLTTLGIIFGVAAVISMLAIARGAKLEIIEQIKYVGTNNIFVVPDNAENKKLQKNPSGAGINSSCLSTNDISSIIETVNTVKYISPEVSYKTTLVFNRTRKKVNILGVSNSYFKIFNLNIEEGYLFNEVHDKNKLPVCIINSRLKNKLFKNSNAIGQEIKCGSQWLKIIGVYKPKDKTLNKIDELNVDFDDNNIYIPYSTMMTRFYNKTSLNFYNMGPLSDEENKNVKNINRIVIQVDDEEKNNATAGLITKILFRLHNNTSDFKVLVPELLIKQQQRAKNIFNFVLGAIATISLIVGGIGIMNIMYASVLERVKEIGIRMSIGANKKDISFQFLSEAVLISIIGGVAGVILGIAISLIIKHIAGINAVISFISIIVAFVVSVGVGILFGFSPAKQAAKKNPIDLLRNE